MLTTVEATIDVDGTVELLEPVSVPAKTRAKLSFEITEIRHQGKGNSAKLLELLESPRFKNRKKYSNEEIDAHIEEIRNSWD
ncbi:MAG TPA: hypothetical protein PKA82_16695 [Pyrinomonadaceae bacterium]|nr:hypothetical protein [Pyrinomonadaceae bacterium]